MSDRPGTLSELLARTVAAHPRRPAVTDARGTRDWAGFAELVAGLAGLLRERGAAPGDRVALWLPNGAEYLALCFACARLSLVAVHVNTRFRAQEVGTLLRRSRAKLLVTAWDFAPVDFPAILAALPAEDRAALRGVIGRGAGPGEIAGLPLFPLAPSAPAPDRSAPDDACLTYTTSGTTSGPKLVLHDQRAIAGHADDVMRAIGTGEPESCLLGAVPFCGTFGNAAAMAAVAGGAHVVCMERFDAAAADALIRRHGVTHAVGGDDMLARLAEAAGNRRHTTMRFFGYAAFHPGAEAAVRAAEAAGLMPWGVYGSSELQALFAKQPEGRRLLPGGDPVNPASVIAMRDPQTGDGLPPGTPGEMCVRAPSMFRFYLDDPATTARAMTADGLFRTGDLARAAGRGFVFETRLGDTLRLGGFLVNPEEIEAFLAARPGIAAAQVVAAEHGGDFVPVAFVRTEPGAALDEAGLIAACRASLARFKVPARVVAVEAFPMTQSPNGEKIQRVRLREMAREILGGL